MASKNWGVGGTEVRRQPLGIKVLWGGGETVYLLIQRNR